MLTSEDQTQEYFTSVSSRHGHKIKKTIIGGPAHQSWLPTLLQNSFQSLKGLVVSCGLVSWFQDLSPLLEAAPNLESLACIKLGLDRHFYNNVLAVAETLRSDSETSFLTRNVTVMLITYLKLLGNWSSHSIIPYVLGTTLLWSPFLPFPSVISATSACRPSLVLDKPLISLPLSSWPVPNWPTRNLILVFVVSDQTVCFWKCRQHCCRGTSTAELCFTEELGPLFRFTCLQGKSNQWIVRTEVAGYQFEIWTAQHCRDSAGTVQGSFWAAWYGPAGSVPSWGIPTEFHSKYFRNGMVRKNRFHSKYFRDGMVRENRTGPWT